MDKLNQLISIEISLKSLKSIIKSKKIKATIWTDDSGITNGEALINLKTLKKQAKSKMNLLRLKKSNILKKMNKDQRKRIVNFLKEDSLVKNDYKI